MFDVEVHIRVPHSARQKEDETSKLGDAKSKERKKKKSSRCNRLINGVKMINSGQRRSHRSNRLSNVFRSLSSRLPRMHSLLVARIENAVSAERSWHAKVSEEEKERMNERS